jgi:alkylated DNA nucleotide flippase Atl1
VAWALRHTDGKLPWHRVLGAGGKILLTGEAGAEQRMRLKAEGVAFHGGKVAMKLHEHQFPSRTRPGRRPTKPLVKSR